MLVNSLILVVMAAFATVLFLPRIRNSDSWRATVTPLASIIGSGFLVVAPLLGYTVGAWAPFAMAGIVVLAYAIGAVVRFNIHHLEPLLDGSHAYISFVERLSNVSLATAYLISVAFYVRLLASFLLHPLAIENDAWIANLITTVILAGIGALGLLRGLHGLEWLEESAVNIKVSIIFALLAGLIWFDIGYAGSRNGPDLPAIGDNIHVLRLLAGMLLVVQGFETSRYLGASYDASLRSNTMRHAQWLAGGIYILFVSLSLPLFGSDQSPPSETAIISISQQVASVLPVLLIVAAIMSQLSAAIADTVGFGGMFSEASAGRFPERFGYGLVVAVAILLVWSIDIFGIIAIASRAFAFYYLLQCIGAWITAGGIEERRRRLLLRGGFSILAVILALVVIFAIPAEAA